VKCEVEESVESEEKKGEVKKRRTVGREVWRKE
jgi:hypothetical protein